MLIFKSSAGWPSTRPALFCMQMLVLTGLGALARLTGAPATYRYRRHVRSIDRSHPKVHHGDRPTVMPLDHSSKLGYTGCANDDIVIQSEKQVDHGGGVPAKLKACRIAGFHPSDHASEKTTGHVGLAHASGRRSRSSSSSRALGGEREGVGG